MKLSWVAGWGKIANEIVVGEGRREKGEGRMEKGEWRRENGEVGTEKGKCYMVAAFPHLQILQDVSAKDWVSWKRPRILSKAASPSVPATSSSSSSAKAVPQSGKITSKAASSSSSSATSSGLSSTRTVSERPPQQCATHYDINAALMKPKSKPQPKGPQ